MITRKDYMADSAKLHHAYYLEIAKAAGIKFTRTDDIARFKKALETDEHMNNIPLGWWDARAAGIQGGYLNGVLKERGEFYSMAGGVCILKAAAREAAKHATEEV